LFEGSGDLSNVPTSTITNDMLGSNLLDVLVKTSIIPSKSEGRRLITQGGLYVNDENVKDINTVVTEDMFKQGYMIVRRGKKSYNKIVIQ
jgi:tyrosyl-tRNA synthetase